MQLVASLFIIFFLPFTAGFLIRDASVPLVSRWWFGLILTGVLLVAFHGFRLPFSLALAAILVLYLAGSYETFKCRRSLIASWAQSLKAPSFRLFPAVLLLITAAAMLNVFANPVTPSNWDAIGIWYKRIKLLYAWTPLANTVDISWGSYINYPHLAAMLEAVIMRVSGGMIEEHGRLLMPALYFFWLSGLSALAPRKGRVLFDLFLAYAALLFYDKWTFTSGYQEGMIVALGGMAALHFCRLLMALDATTPGLSVRVESFLAFFFAGSLCLVKNEAAILAAILAFSAAAAAMTFPERLKTLKMIGPGFAVFLTLAFLWPAIMFANDIDMTRLQNKAFTRESVMTLHHNLSRWSVIEPYFKDYFSAKPWLILSCASFSLLAASFRPARRPLFFLWIVYTAHLVFMPLPYLATHAGLGWHLKNSFERLILQHGFLYPLMLSIAISAAADKLLPASGRKSE